MSLRFPPDVIVFGNTGACSKLRTALSVTGKIKLPAWGNVLDQKLLMKTEAAWMNGMDRKFTMLTWDTSTSCLM